MIRIKSIFFEKDRELLNIDIDDYYTNYLESSKASQSSIK